MKKVSIKLGIFMVLTIVMCMLMSSVSYASEFIKGDLDSDSKVTAADARIVLRMSAKLQTASEEELRAGDTDGDLKITASDARTVLRVAAKLEEFLPEKSVEPKPETSTQEKEVSSEQSTEIPDKTDDTDYSSYSVEKILAKYTEVMNNLKENSDTYNKTRYQNIPKDKCDFGKYTPLVMASMYSYFVPGEEAYFNQCDYPYGLPLEYSDKGCLLTDTSAIKSAEISEKDGKVTIVLVLNDEVNPRPLESNTGYVFSTISDGEMKYALGIMSAIDINSSEQTYHDCVSTVVFDPVSLHVESVEQVMNINAELEFTAFAYVKDSGHFELTDTTIISNIQYNDILDFNMDKLETGLKYDMGKEWDAVNTDTYSLDTTLDTDVGKSPLTLSVKGDKYLAKMSMEDISVNIMCSGDKIYMIFPDYKMYCPMNAEFMSYLGMDENDIDSMFNASALDEDDKILGQCKGTINGKEGLCTVYTSDGEMSYVYTCGDEFVLLKTYNTNDGTTTVTKINSVSDEVSDVTFSLDGYTKAVSLFQLIDMFMQY